MFAACVVAAASGCSDREDLDGERRELPGLLDTAAERQRDLGDRRVALDLFDNSARLHVHAGGSLVVDVSDVSFVKYTDGGQRAPWLRGKGGGALTDGLGAEIWVPLDRDPGGADRRLDESLRIAWRARAAAPGQLVSVFFNETKLGDVAMPSMDWSSYEITAPASAVIDGENKLRFYFRSAGEISGSRTAAAFQRIAIGGTANVAEAALSRGPHTAGDVRQASLGTPGAGRLSLYATIPEEAPELVLSVAGEGKASVRVRPGGGASAELWSGDLSASWRDETIDLAAYAGQVVRLDLVSSGAAQWGRPLITAAPAKERALEVEAADHIVVWSVASLRADRGDRYQLGGLSGRARAPGADPARGHAAVAIGRRDAGDRLEGEVVTLAEKLRRAGYATMLAADSSAALAARGLDRGFDARASGGSAVDLWKKAREHIAAHAGEQTFVYLATTEPELPYTCKTDIEGLEIRPEKTAMIADKARAGRWALTAGERRSVIALYDACVAENAAALAGALAGLRELGVADRSAVIVVGVNGSELFERGAFGRGRGLGDEGVLVPLRIDAPGVGDGVAVDAGIELVDLHATILELAGVAPDAAVQGESILAAARTAPPLPVPVYLSSPGEGRALVLGEHKLVVPAQGDVALYDLGADPAEKESEAAAQPVVTRALRDVLAIGAAFEAAWSAVRWGSANDLAPAFAADQGQ